MQDNYFELRTYASNLKYVKNPPKSLKTTSLTPKSFLHANTQQVFFIHFYQRVQQKQQFVCKHCILEP